MENVIIPKYMSTVDANTSFMSRMYLQVGKNKMSKLLESLKEYHFYNLE